MSSRKKGFKKYYALFIILLMILGVIAGAFIFYHPDCGGPKTAQFSKVYTTTINGQTYEAVDANFTGRQPENFVFLGVTFLTAAFSDPSLPHLSGFTCAVDNSTPASISLQVTFSSDGTVVLLPDQGAPFLFKGSLSQQIGPVFAQHVNPTAGIVWYPYQPWVVLLVST